jgi:hypothetical protein
MVGGVLIGPARGERLRKLTRATRRGVKAGLKGRGRSPLAFDPSGVLTCGVTRR